AVRLEIRDHDVDAALLQLVRLRQHLVRLADAGGVAEKDLQAAARGSIRHVRWGKTRTSMPSAPSINRSSGLPRSQARQSRRRLCPTKSWVMPCSRAYSRIVATGSFPSRTSTWARSACATLMFRSLATMSCGVRFGWLT